MSKLKYATDIDGPLCLFSEGFYEYFNEPFEQPTVWDDPFIRENFHKIIDDDKFWLGLKPACNPKDIVFEVSAYITARPCRSELTAEWLFMHGFPVAPVITVGIKPDGTHHSKVQAILDNEIDIFYEDAPHHFEEVSMYCLCFLHDAPYNQHIFTPNRITSIKEIKRWKKKDLDIMMESLV